MVPDLEYQNFIQLIEPGYMNLGPREASLVSSGSAKSKLGLPTLKNKKRGGKVSYALCFKSAWLIIQLYLPKIEVIGKFYKNNFVSEMK